MTSDAPRRRRNRRRRADERARCERSLEFLPSRAAIVRAIVRASTREDGRLARSRKTHQMMVDSLINRGLPPTSRRHPSPSPSDRSKRNRRRKKKNPPLSPNEPTPPSFARTPSPVYLRNPKARSPKLERATTIVARTRRALSKREDPTRRATRSSPTDA